ncbi:nitroreductase family protein [Actinomyces vulturis]|uniref:nitroreductase family protein n=1 Tax=Actinomyces vulturis TaxID=1857645 RepID=UPI000837131B|nr:nitroreductase family protein [Actinomyces vulturis]
MHKEPPFTEVRNSTIDILMAHRSIRAFSSERVTDDIMDTLFDVARHSATSAYLQQMSMIHVRDAQVRQEVAAVSGQPYVGGDRGELLIFVVDLYRNAQIRRRNGASITSLHRTNLFLQGCEDALISAQSVCVAAESLGLGTVYLGSIVSDPARMIEILHLPELTFPLVGMLVGYPDQEPQFKPRLPSAVTVMTDSYDPIDQESEAFRDYNDSVTHYYDLRDPSTPLTSFSHRISTLLGLGASEQSEILDVLHRQGLCWK